MQAKGHFVLSINATSGGRKYCELILDKVLDLEQQQEKQLLLAAVDGGILQR